MLEPIDRLEVFKNGATRVFEVELERIEPVLTFNNRKVDKIK